LKRRRMGDRRETHAPIRGREGGPDRIRTSPLADRTVDAKSEGTLARMEECVIAVMKDHHDLEDLGTPEREALAVEIIDTVRPLEPDEAIVAARLFRMILSKNGTETKFAISEDGTHAVGCIRQAMEAKDTPEEKLEERKRLIAEHSKDIAHRMKTMQALRIASEIYPEDRKRIVETLQNLPYIRDVSPGEMRGLAIEVGATLGKLTGTEEKMVAMLLYQMVLGIEREVPKDYAESVDHLVAISEKEAQAEATMTGKNENEGKKTTARGLRPMLIIECTRQIITNAAAGQLQSVGTELAKLDDDIRELGLVVMQCLSGASVHAGSTDTGKMLSLLERIPQAYINQVGAEEAVLTVCRLWQQLRNEGIDGDLVFAGLSAFAAMNDQTIEPKGLAKTLIDRMPPEGEPSQRISIAVRQISA
jgi:hypothetical protein